MLAKTFSAAVIGIDAYPVEIEVNVSGGTANAPENMVSIVGLPDAAVKESKDRVRLLSAGTYEVKAEAKIAGFKLSPRNYRIADVNRFYQRNWNRAAGKFTAYEVTLDRDLEFSDGDFLDLPGLAVSDFTIRDNYFHDHRARGLRIMSSDGVIENNRIERTKSAAISVGCEYGYWREAGWGRQEHSGMKHSRKTRNFWIYWMAFISILSVSRIPMIWRQLLFL